jgi:hypothetical protein
MFWKDYRLSAGRGIPFLFKGQTSVALLRLLRVIIELYLLDFIDIHLVI